jgi:SAM-dependent methyltransferase
MTKPWSPDPKAYSEKGADPLEVDVTGQPGAHPARSDCAEGAKDLSPILRCPMCERGLRFDDGGYSCAFHGQFPAVQGQAVLVDFESSILVRERFLARGGASHMARPTVSPWLRRILKGTNKGAARAATTFLRALPAGARVLVIGGAVKGWGSEALYGDDLDLITVDIYPSALTTMIADAHKLPFKDQVFDAVWIQAVLEHVLDPQTVVAEIHRVLKSDGLVFADTPFLQPVHEAPYDFMRFTSSGHRWLFRHFEEIQHGVTGGAGTMLLWAIRYFVRATTGSLRLGWLVCAPLFWLRFFDRDEVRHRDAACGFHFFGRKSARPVLANEMPSYYR